MVPIKTLLVCLFLRYKAHFYVRKSVYCAQKDEILLMKIL